VRRSHGTKVALQRIFCATANITSQLCPHSILFSISFYCSAVSWGAPIGIGDKLLFTQCFGIDEYEENRPPRCLPEEFRVPRDIRERTLIEEGYSRSEILQVTLKTDRIRNRRHNVARGGPIRQIQTFFLRHRFMSQSVLGKRATPSS